MVKEHAMSADTVTISAHGGDEIEAYAAQVGDATPRGGVVVIHHMPGYDRESKEFVRRFAAGGWNSICPNLYSREAPGAEPDDAAATARAGGGVPDERLLGDVTGAIEYLKGLPNSNGKIGVIGHCSGGRQTWLTACSLHIDAAVPCYPGFVVEASPDGFPVTMKAILHLAPNLSCPMLGMFGNEDKYPSPDQVDAMEKALEDAGKTYEFHRYDGAGHGFFGVDHASYRVEAAVDGWSHIYRWFETYLAS